MSAINEFCVRNAIRIADNPCVSPDFCLDWPALRRSLEAGAAAKHWPELITWKASRFPLAAGQVRLMEDPESGDCAWFVDGGAPAGLEDGVHLGGQRHAFPCTWNNLLVLKNLAQEYDPGCTVFPVARGDLARRSLGIGARFTTLHWPAVDWAMAALELSLTANQNSVPRELVYNVDAMLAGKLDQVRFPFIGGSVPEGHQGQSVEGMSHGAVLAKLRHGFHHHRIPWGFNADHQPIGGKFDDREDALVRGSALATYITFDLSPELLATEVPENVDAIARRFEEQVGADVAGRVRTRVSEAGVDLDDAGFRRLLVEVWPAVEKMARRDRAYAAERARLFTTDVGRAYFRELSIDELPGLTTPETLATMLALCEVLGMPVQFVAPAFGFQKNFPFEDDAELERRVSAAWAVCERFGVSIGFHSGSGKSAENYRTCGRLTGSNLEIKTSGRYTYEMGAALAESDDPADRALWQDWYAFTRDLALVGAFSEDDDERRHAREFIAHALRHEGRDDDVFADPESCAAALAAIDPNPDHMFWFEFNFLFVLAAGGTPAKEQLGDHGVEGYAQRARFYRIGDAGRLAYARRVAGYICFLAEHTGLAPAHRCNAARERLAALTSYDDLLADIAPQGAGVAG